MRRLAVKRSKDKSSQKPWAGQSDLTLFEIVSIWRKQEGRCAYTGVLMKESGREWDSMSIDRVDPLKGYTAANVVICCFGVNNAKSNMPFRDFVRMCKAVAARYGEDETLEAK